MDITHLEYTKYNVLSKYLIGYRGVAMACYRRIRELREDHDMTQRQVAALLHMPQPQYFRYEQGYRDPPTDILIALADLYHTSVDYILGRTNNPHPYE